MTPGAPNLLYARIMAELLGDLRCGRLRAGSRVPSEMELAARFGVSRITSRRALEVLAKAGIVERSQGRGTFVRASLPDLEQVSHELGLAPQPPELRSSLIGLVLPDFSESYGLGLVYGVEQTCARLGHHLLLRRSGGERRSEEAAIRQLREAGASALLVFPVHGEHYSPQLLQTVLDGFPVILIDRYLRGIPAPSVSTDNVAAARALAEHLLELGHRQIAFVSPPVTHTTSLEDRLEGLRLALEDHGIHARPELALQSLLSTLPRHFEVQEVLHDQSLLQTFIRDNGEVTAFFVAEYNLARSLRRALTDLGRRVPEDVSVVCFDSPGDPLGAPPFTHIAQDQAAMGAAAVELALSLLRGVAAPLRTHIPFTLVPGPSSAPVRPDSKETQTHAARTRSAAHPTPQDPHPTLSPAEI